MVGFFGSVWFWVAFFREVFCITSKILNTFKCLKALETPNALAFLLPVTLLELCVFPK